MKEAFISDLRYYSHKIVQELAALDLESVDDKNSANNWYVLNEIKQSGGSTLSSIADSLAIHISTVCRVLEALKDHGLVKQKFGADKREKFLEITKKGLQEIAKIEKKSNQKFLNAFRFLGQKDQDQIVDAIKKYAHALEKARVKNHNKEIKILTLSNSKILRNNIKKMIDDILQNEYGVYDDNSCVIKAEEEFYYNNSCNFWYAIDEKGAVIGSVGLFKIDANNAEIKKFYVDKQYRGRKVAQGLILKLLQAAKTHKITNLYLGTIDILKNAVSFYEKYGFERVSKKAMPAKFKFCEVDNMFYKIRTEKLVQKFDIN